MSRKVDSNFPDVCRKVIKCDRVVAAIKEAADEEFNELQEEEAGIPSTLTVRYRLTVPLKVILATLVARSCFHS